MKNYQAVIFDLDGTLADSLIDIADAMNKTLQEFGYPTHDYESYKYFVGNGLKNLVINCLPESSRNETRIELCFEKMVDNYKKSLVNNTRLYIGIDDLLNALSERNLKLAVLSNKADELTQEICNTLLNKWNFNIILGASSQFPRKPDPEAAIYLAEKMNSLPENTLYIGDTNVDMKTANAAGMFAVGVTWGFRTKKELEESGAQLIIDKPMELIDKLKL